MSYGLRVWDASGNLHIDTSTLMGRILGQVAVTGAGSVTNAGFATGTPFYLELHKNNNPAYLSFTMSGTTLSWTVTNSSYSVDSVVLYGVY